MNAPTHNPSIKSTLVFLIFCAVLAGIFAWTCEAELARDAKINQEQVQW